ncbi:MAG: hypothetical protein JJ863_38685 [Deltaproteobacteria bacterium]|nr:hypothetical protein [Deltaproteobacteria bacterium]
MGVWDDDFDTAPPSGIRIGRFTPIAVLDSETLRLNGWADSPMADRVQAVRDPNRLERWLRDTPRCHTLVVGLADRQRDEWWADTLEVLAEVSRLRPLRLLADIRRCDRHQAGALIDLGAVLTAAGPFEKCMRERELLDARAFAERLRADRAMRLRLFHAIGVSELSNEAGLTAAEHRVLLAHMEVNLRDLPRLLHVQRTTIEKQLGSIRRKLGGESRLGALHLAFDAAMDCAYWLGTRMRTELAEE